MRAGVGARCFREVSLSERSQRAFNHDLKALRDELEELQERFEDLGASGSDAAKSVQREMTEKLEPKLSHIFSSAKSVSEDWEAKGKRLVSEAEQEGKRFFKRAEHAGKGATTSTAKASGAHQNLEQHLAGDVRCRLLMARR